MTNLADRPVLITGSHRSGSTWAGKMLSFCPSVAYIHEPFNLHHRPGICAAKFDCWFPYICDVNQSLYINEITDCFNFRYQLTNELRATRSLRDLARMSRDFSHFTLAKFTGKRPLIKDPIAFFSAEWLDQKFNMQVVILIRHPAAFAGSLKQAKWAFPFNHFLQQPLLMDRHLSKFRGVIEQYAENPQDIVDQAVLLWNIIHQVILFYRDRHKSWIFVKHETLSENPATEFKNLYTKLGLEYSNRIENRIKNYSRTDSKDKLKRDSRANIKNWSRLLTTDEINRVKSNTRELADEFYSESDWNLPDQD